MPRQPGTPLAAQPDREVPNMKTSPWHSIKSGVHHNDTDCNTGNNIERENLRYGTGGKPLCAECASLPRRDSTYNRYRF